MNAAYDASSIDWQALKHLAQLTARGTSIAPAPLLNYVDRGEKRHVKVLGPHWVLDHRWEKSEEKTSGGYIEETHVDEVYALLHDGSLAVVKVTEEALISPGYVGVSFRDGHTVRDMADVDVEAFDHAKARYGGDRVRGDLVSPWRGRGTLQYGAKGAGLVKRLEDLLRGRTSELPNQIGRLQDPGLEARHHADQAAAAKTMTTRARKKYLATANERLQLAAKAWLFIASVILATNYMTSRGQAFVDGSYWVAAAILIVAVAGATAVDLLVGSGSTPAFVAGAVAGFALPAYQTVTDPLLDTNGLSLVPFLLVPVGGLVGYGITARQRRNGL